MYRAKHKGKARYEVFEPSMGTDALERLWLENELRRALERGEFKVYYQPVVALEGGRIVGAEALVRWEHPIRGLLLPEEFRRRGDGPDRADRGEGASRSLSSGAGVARTLP